MTPKPELPLSPPRPRRRPAPRSTLWGELFWVAFSLYWIVASSVQDVRLTDATFGDLVNFLAWVMFTFILMRNLIKLGRRFVVWSHG